MANKLVQNLSADAWAAMERFYAPMPLGAESPVTIPEPDQLKLLVPDDLDDWHWDYACGEINRLYDGVPPKCAACGIVILCFPFKAVTSREWIKCNDCWHREVHKGHNGSCERSPHCVPGC